MKGGIVANNIVDNLWVGPEHVAVEDYNVVGERNPHGRHGPHDVFGSPRFVAPDRLDYSLMESSPGVDSAGGRYAPSTDFDGKPRVGGPDRGALEHAPPRGLLAYLLELLWPRPA
jgi:hypothetical protein